ncbi:MAG: energy-coupled thiamine transporter ThiT [Lachnospiraceae bacterium]|nr:energy-coupled thiamine transporter ThiT [Lachnospiraceae bacterium]
MYKRNGVRILVESALMLAIGTVLSIFKLLSLPYGGSVTIASMLPVIIIAYRNGTGAGIVTGLAFSLIQQLLGLKNLGYVTGWVSVVAVIFLDYVLAFTVTGLGGIFRNKARSQAQALVLGALFTSILRYFFHVISGATVWAGISIPTTAALVYSIGYNATYMIPETIVLTLVAYYIGISLDLRKQRPSVMKRSEQEAFPWPKLVAGLLFVAALVFATVLVFAKLQDPETGDFMITGLNDVNWALVLSVSLPLMAAAGVLFGLSDRITSKKANVDKKDEENK